jgi:hypothetical protein
LTGASAQTITGIAGGTDGRMITLVNAASQAATIANNSGSSVAANRITTGTGSNVTLAAGASINLVYDSSASLWRIVGTTVAGAPGSYVTLQGSTPGTADTGNLNISGTGIAANLQGTTSVKTALLDTVSAGTLSVGTSTATAISIGKSGVTTTITGNLAQQTGTFNLTGNAGSQITTTSGQLLLQAAGGVNIFTTSGTGSTPISIKTGDASAGTAGVVQIDTGTSSTGSSLIGIGTNNAGLINIGNATAATTTNINGGTGLGAINLQAGTGGNIRIGFQSSNTVTIGDTGGGVTTLQSGGGTAINYAGTSSALTVTATANPTGSNGLIVANNNSTTPSGNLISLQNKGVNKFTVDVDGNQVTSGSIQGGGLITTSSGSLVTQKGTDYSTTGSSNDVSFGSGSLYRLTGATAQTITGIAGGVDGRRLTLINAGANAAIIANNSGSSIAANRITTGTGASITLPSGGSINLVYDSAASLWRVIGSVSTTSNFVTLQGSTPGTADTGNLNISGTGIAANLQGTTSVKTALLDTVSAGTLNIGTTTATAISIGGSGITTTFTGTLVVGSGGNTMTITSTGYVLAGNARNQKIIRLPAEYAGAVLDTGATGNNVGTMTSGYDQTNRMNYYKWTTTQVSNQTYDVVVQVALPKDFDAWNTSPIQLTTYTSDTTNGTITVQVIKSNGSADSNFSSFQSATPGSTSTWATTTFSTLDSSNYTAGDYITIRIRMQSPTSGDIRIGNLVLNYLANR